MCACCIWYLIAQHSHMAPNRAIAASGTLQRLEAAGKVFLSQQYSSTYLCWEHVEESVEHVVARRRPNSIQLGGQHSHIALYSSCHTHTIHRACSHYWAIAVCDLITNEVEETTAIKQPKELSKSDALTGTWNKNAELKILLKGELVSSKVVKNSIKRKKDHSIIDDKLHLETLRLLPLDRETKVLRICVLNFINFIGNGNFNWRFSAFSSIIALMTIESQWKVKCELPL